MKLEGAVVFITGANRGLGLELAKQALARGAKKVYAAARDPSTVTLPGVTPVRLDVTDAAQAEAAARDCGDVTVLINNAGIGRLGSLLSDEGPAVLHAQLDTNLIGMLNVTRAFAGILGRNGGGALLNMLSILSWANTPMIAGYGVSKAAAWALTNGLRHELRAQGTLVTGFHAGYIDTDMIRAFDVPKARPEDVIRLALDAVEAGEEEVLVDEPTRQVKAALSGGVYLKDVLAG
ncbi:SDR family oxidoreductase [Burkholderia sp. Ac-20379]|uniref:SDR family oxidoreductase n=1 Tax=Burkholderia sp. Ac-20379 TaxID=2703900 RepID=UPI00197E5D53|nr:SDR family oxidoreductase [Burkholderia sp. Ac-20379]MBN3726327.1 SDR family oxidoreductase [Burkholderia sp. Ac-20379]